MRNEEPGRILKVTVRRTEKMTMFTSTSGKLGKTQKKLSMISEKLYAAADEEISPNASDIGITELSKVIETSRNPSSTSTSLTSSMRTVVDKAEKALASILKMYPQTVSTYGTSLNSRNLTTAGCRHQGTKTRSATRP